MGVTLVPPNVGAPLASNPQTIAGIPADADGDQDPDNAGDPRQEQRDGSSLDDARGFL